MISNISELVGTPCYMAPETIKKSMYPDAPGYGRPADMLVFVI